MPPTAQAEEPVPPEQTENPKEVIHRAVYLTLGHVRGSELPRDVAELLRDDSMRGEIIFRVGQALGPLGLTGAEVAAAHESLARLPTTAEEVLAAPEAHDQTDEVR